jgi:Zn-dependent peptidase ImmA (M78 family)
VVELRRGFKTEANDLAREIRKELGLQLLDPLDPWLLADHLAIEVIALSELADDADGAVRHLLHVDPASFSAVTVFYGTERLVVHNDAHSPGRQASNLSHELSHGLLLHPPAPALDAGGCRNWDPVLEGEAQYLAGALLITEEAALQIVRSGKSLDAAAVRFGVSSPMVQYRINVTGARQRVSRARRSRRSGPTF